MNKLGKEVVKIMFYILKAIITGATIGGLIGLYQLLSVWISEQGIAMFNEKSLWLILIAFFVVAFNYWSLKVEKSIGGSGIPFMELVIRKKQTLKYYFALPLMFINSLFSFFLGFCLGSEGPSVYMGGCVGIASNKIFKDDDSQNIAVSAASGFGCAFLSPVAGVIYCFEESLDHHFNHKLVLKALITVFSAFFVTRLINKHEILEMEIIDSMRLSDYWVLLFIVILGVVSSIIFTLGIIKTKDFLNKHKDNIIVKCKSLIVMILVVTLGYFFLKYMGSGGKIINLALANRSLKIIFLVLVFRFVMTILCANSNYSGGLLVPMFAIGALNGALVFKVFENYLDEGLLSMLIFLSILIVYACVTSSPLTALALGLSIVKIKYIIFPIIIVIPLSYFFHKLFKVDDIYELLKDRLPKISEEKC